MKSILFVINTMGMGGGEKALLELLKQMDLEKYDISLFVLTGQGELINQVPENIRIVNKRCFPVSVLDSRGKRRLMITVLRALFFRGVLIKRFGYIMRNLCEMAKQRNIRSDKLFWKILSDGAEQTDREYDLAVAYLEGGSAYYVTSHVKAEKKVAFIHTNYRMAGYNRKLDEDCYLKFDHIFTVAEKVREEFLAVYPECKGYTEIFYNLIDREKIISKAKEKGGFSDNFTGFRILTVGRLVPEKAHEIEIKAMQILKKTGGLFRWYVLGEGKLRKKLEEQVDILELQEDFVFLGTVNNPFPYYDQCDLYVHAAYLEGKSIAIEEAQILGCAILASDHSGVREQIADGVDGKIYKLEPEILAENIVELANNPQRRKEYGLAASKKEQVNGVEEIKKLLDLLL